MMLTHPGPQDTRSDPITLLTALLITYVARGFIVYYYNQHDVYLDRQTLSISSIEKKKKKKKTTYSWACWLMTILLVDIWVWIEAVSLAHRRSITGSPSSRILA